MIKSLKKVAISGCLLTFLVVPTVYSEDASKISIHINDKNQNFIGYIENERTIVPLRNVCEQFGAIVLWDSKDKKITIIKDEKKVEMKLNDYGVIINGHQKYMDAIPTILNDTTYVPLRFLSENLGYSVGYDASTKTVNLENKKENSIVIVNKTEAKKGDLEVDIQYPQIEGLENSEIQDKINKIFTDHVAAYKKETADFENEVIEFKKESDFTGNYLININYDVKYNSNNILSLVFTNYQYTGGAHGNYYNKSYTINLLTGELYNLKDLFNAGTGYKTIINDVVKKEFGETDTLAEFESITENQEYYLSDDAIVVYFGLYEYAPYAAGIPEFKIPFNTYSEIINTNLIKDITENSQNISFGLKNEVQQKNIMENFNTIIEKNVTQKDLIRFINNEIAYISKENASKMVLAVEDLQIKNIMTYSSALTENGIEQRIMKEFLKNSKFEFDINKIENIKDTEIKNIIKNTIDNGYKIFQSEGMLNPIIDYSKYLKYCEYVTDDISEYIKIMTEETTNISTDDAAIVIPWDNIFKRTLAYEQFINKYPSSEIIKEIKNLYDMYIRYYLLGANNTPAFDYESKSLDKELLQSYETSINEATKNRLQDSLVQYLDVLKKNQFKLNEEVENFRSNILKNLIFEN